MSKNSLQDICNYHWEVAAQAHNDIADMHVENLIKMGTSMPVWEMRLTLFGRLIYLPNSGGAGEYVLLMHVKVSIERWNAELSNKYIRIICKYRRQRNWIDILV